MPNGEKAMRLDEGRILYNDLAERIKNVPSVDNVVAVTDVEPTEEGVKIWLPETPPQAIQVPTYAEFQELGQSVDGKMSEEMSSLLTEINSRYTKPNTGIPATDMAQAVQTSLGKADSAYQKPQTGIPASDMAEGVIPDITGKADKTVTDALQKDKAPVIIDSAEGNPIVLTDGANGLPIEGMKIHFLPKQSGTGDPSPDNVRPISGWQGLTAWRTGANLLDKSNYENSKTSYGVTFTKNDDGSITANGTASGGNATFTLYCSQLVRSKLSFLQNSIVTMSGCPSGGSTATYYINGFRLANDGNLSAADTGQGITFAFSIGEGNPNIAIVVKDGKTVNNLIFRPQIELGSTASPYAEYTGQSYPVVFPDGQTVYGGTLDAVNGVLTVTHAMKYLGNLNYTMQSGSDNVKVFTTAGFGDKKHGVTNIISDLFVTTSVTSWGSTKPDNSICGSASSTTVVIRADAYADAGLLKTALDGHVAVYELATPYEIHLDPITVQTLIGDNTIWTDANGTIELDYRADTKLWISGHSIMVDSALSDTSENPVKNKVIKTALDGKEPLHNTSTVSGTTPTITGVENTRYICGECATLSITAPASGCIDVVFESGSTPTVLTVSSAKTGVTEIKWANGFDPTALEANTTYEINILDGEFGVVGKWT